MCGSMADIQSAAAKIRRGKKIEDRKNKQTCFRHAMSSTPPVNNTSAMTIIWRIRAEVIRTVLCCVLQLCTMICICTCTVLTADCWFWFSLYLGLLFVSFLSFCSHVVCLCCFRLARKNVSEMTYFLSSWT